MNYTNNAFADLFKNSFDFNQLFSTQRRNLEALSAANQVVAEGVQEGFRNQAEVLRSNVETVLKASKDAFSSGSPEAGIAKQAELAKSIFETTLSNLREATEMATKCGFEAFEVLNKRASENLNEISKVAAHPKKKQA